MLMSLAHAVHTVRNDRVRARQWKSQARICSDIGHWLVDAIEAVLALAVLPGPLIKRFSPNNKVAI